MLGEQFELLVEASKGCPRRLPGIGTELSWLSNLPECVVRARHALLPVLANQRVNIEVDLGVGPSSEPYTRCASSACVHNEIVRRRSA
jgi:hypothetical protein